MNDWPWEMSTVSKLTLASISAYGNLSQDSNSAGERGAWKLHRQLLFPINVGEDNLNPFQLVCPEQGIRLTEMNWQFLCYLGNLIDPPCSPRPLNSEPLVGLGTVGLLFSLRPIKTCIPASSSHAVSI